MMKAVKGEQVYGEPSKISRHIIQKAIEGAHTWFIFVANCLNIKIDLTNRILQLGFVKVRSLTPQNRQPLNPLRSPIPIPSPEAITLQSRTLTHPLPTIPYPTSQKIVFFGGQLLHCDKSLLTIPHTHIHSTNY